jgi:hypothetical protein
METQNITLALPKDVLRKAKLMAVERGTSLSGLLTRVLVEMVAQEDHYMRAKSRFLDRLDHPLDLGTGGHAHWSREELHER